MIITACLILFLYVLVGITTIYDTERGFVEAYLENGYNLNELEKVRSSVYENWAEEQIAKGFVRSVFVLWIGPMIFWPVYVMDTIPSLEEKVIDAMN